MEEYYADDITFNCDPKIIYNVSDLRHHINCHGVSKQLLSHLRMSVENLEDVYNHCFGKITIEELLQNKKDIIKKCKKERKNKEQAIIKNEQLVLQLRDMRKTFCNLGTRRTKLFLNTLVKQGDEIALIIRTLIETEDENIKAKENRYYADHHYYAKYQLILKLLHLYCDNGKLSYGIQETDNYSANHIVYFELPNGEQISFHTNFEENDLNGLPIYEKPWDGKVNSTLPKLEQFVITNWKDELNKKIEYYANKDNKNKTI